jgi:putative flippase GtrA
VTTPDRVTSARTGRWRLTNDSVARQFGRFVLVGISNTAISFVAYAVLIRVGVPYWASGAFAFALGAANGYILNRRWTFAARDTMRARLRYLVVQTAGLGATVALLWLFVSSAGIDRLAAYPITIPIVTLTTFFANKGWTFGSELAKSD